MIKFHRFTTCTLLLTQLSPVDLCNTCLRFWDRI